QDRFMKERGCLVRVFRLDGFARTRRPRSIPALRGLALHLGDVAVRGRDARGDSRDGCSTKWGAFVPPTFSSIWFVGEREIWERDLDRLARSQSHGETIAQLDG